MVYHLKVWYRELLRIIQSLKRSPPSNTRQCFAKLDEKWDMKSWHYCIQRAQRINSLFSTTTTYNVLTMVLKAYHLLTSPPSAAYMRQWTGSALFRKMASHLFGIKPLAEPILAYCQLDYWEHISVKRESEFYHFHSTKIHVKSRLPDWGPFCPGGDELKKPWQFNSMNENFFISIQIPLKFVSKGPIDKKSAMVQVMHWRRSGDNPLSQPMVASASISWMMKCALQSLIVIKIIIA